VLPRSGYAPGDTLLLGSVSAGQRDSSGDCRTLGQHFGRTGRAAEQVARPSVRMLAASLICECVPRRPYRNEGMPTFDPEHA